MKLYLVKEFSDEYRKKILTVNNWYDGDLTPTMYNPYTYNKVSPSYIVKCNDSQWRKVDSVYFITQEEWRESKLNQIL
jgi:hypothetical protein